MRRGKKHHERIAPLRDELREWLDRPSPYDGSYPGVRVTKMGRDVEAFRYTEQPEVLASLDKAARRKSERSQSFQVPMQSIPTLVPRKADKFNSL